jgi:hypothetical protein
MRAGFDSVSVAMRLRDSGGLARSRLCGGARLGGDYFACRLADNNIGSIPDRHCTCILSCAYLESPGYVQYSKSRGMLMARLTSCYSYSPMDVHGAA